MTMRKPNRMISAGRGALFHGSRASASTGRREQ
jgi:hypothetical protein